MAFVGWRVADGGHLRCSAAYRNTPTPATATYRTYRALYLCLRCRALPASACCLIHTYLWRAPRTYPHHYLALRHALPPLRQVHHYLRTCRSFLPAHACAHRLPPPLRTLRVPHTCYCAARRGYARKKKKDYDMVAHTHTTTTYSLTPHTHSPHLGGRHTHATPLTYTACPRRAYDSVLA